MLNARVNTILLQFEKHQQITANYTIDDKKEKFYWDWSVSIEERLHRICGLY